MPICKQAGVAFAALGIESDSPEVQRRINKGNAVSESTAAVGLLRRAGIIALIHMMYGLESETPKTVWCKVRSIKLFAFRQYRRRLCFGGSNSRSYLFICGPRYSLGMAEPRSGYQAFPATRVMSRLQGLAGGNR